MNDAPFKFAYYHQHEIDPRKLVGYQTDLLTDLAIQYLEVHEREEPLFLVLSPEPPHFPLHAPASFKRFDIDKLKTRENFIDLPGRREQLATYYAMVGFDQDRNRKRPPRTQINRFSVAVFGESTG